MSSELLQCAAGMQQRAVRDDIIYDKHTGLANFISIFGESPRQINVVVPAQRCYNGSL